MPKPESNCINRDQYDAVLFDLDGVLTDTARLHATCWKRMFDRYLQKRSQEKNETFQPFDIASDYRLYVDGKPRFAGVRDFLESREIELPEGDLEDPADRETVCGLGNRKDDLVNNAIETLGARPYDGSVRFNRYLQGNGFKIAVVTSSQNCTAVLQAAELDKFFDVRVDGNMIQAERIAGKPSPDTFLLAARLLEVEPMRAIVIEDAISGVQAGSSGHFGLVIGVARKGNEDELKRHGAHLVVRDLDELID